MLVRVEYSLLLVQSWMLVDKQLQTNFSTSVVRSQVGHPVLANIEWYNWQTPTDVINL